MKMYFINLYLLYCRSLFEFKVFKSNCFFIQIGVKTYLEKINDYELYVDRYL